MNKQEKAEALKLYHSKKKAEGALQMDYVGKVETLQHDLSKIMDDVGIQPPAVSINEYYRQMRADDKVTNSSFHEHYSTYYSDELLKNSSRKRSINL